jgi:N-acetylneuraminate epimerase
VSRAVPFDTVAMRWLLLALLVTLPARGNWRKLAPIPNESGVAGAFAGVSGGALILAGGANFPGKKPWAGGEKVWHDAVYVLERPDGQWRTAGRLPRPLGYGVCVTHGGGVVCAGGSDAKGHYADVFRLTWADGKTRVTPLPPLPEAMANAAGALLGEVLYVAGGIDRPDSVAARRAVYRLDLSTPNGKWEAVDPIPGTGRMLSVAAAIDGSFWLIGGVELSAADDGKARRSYLKEAWRYRPGKAWERMADLPRAVAAAPSPAMTDAGAIRIFGGDDGANVSFTPIDQHPGFSRTESKFDLAKASWADAEAIAEARVTTPLVRWGNLWVVPSGEVRPGVRSAEVWAYEAAAPGGQRRAR